MGRRREPSLKTFLHFSAEIALMRHRKLALLAIVPLALLVLGAAPGDQAIPHPRYEGEALIIPPDSPIQFRGFDENGVAHFSGRFVLAGRFYVEGCSESCPGATEEDLGVSVFPDPALEARLPHWKVHNNNIALELSEKRLMNMITGPQQRAALIAGKTTGIRGRIAIVVDEFETGIECDSAYFSARFVAVAKQAKIANVEFNGNYGCL